VIFDFQFSAVRRPVEIYKSAIVNRQSEISGLPPWNTPADILFCLVRKSLHAAGILPGKLFESVFPAACLVLVLALFDV